MNGKGSTRRPSTVSGQTYADNWERTFRGRTAAPSDPASEADWKKAFDHVRDHILGVSDGHRADLPRCPYCYRIGSVVALDDNGVCPECWWSEVEEESR